MPAATKRILLAEDDSFLSTLLKTRIEREGFAVTVVGRGDEVVPALKKQKHDLLLLDIILPGKVGYEILDDLDKFGMKTPFMVISNLAQQEDIKRAKEYGAIEYFIKAHIAIDDLIKRIRTFLGSA
jgi:DNA-binding response OmpR family regulator